jgi:hypothetical protein
MVNEPGSEALARGLERVATLRFDSSRLRSHAQQFSRERHAQRLNEVIEETAAAPVGARW